MDYGTVSDQTFVLLGIGAALFLIVPVVISIIWKKKKKEPPFATPEWAKDLNALIEKVNNMKKYVGMSQDLGLDEEFLTQAKDQLKRFAKEIPFRKEEEEALR